MTNDPIGATEESSADGVAFRHDAFISYQSTSSQGVARFLQRELERIARRSLGSSPIRLFRDETSLTFSVLGDSLRRELAASRRLLVVLHRDTRDSPWVNQEIAEWLAAGGSPDRLILIRADASLDLSWDSGRMRFAHEDDLPPALAEVFTAEPLWLDLSQPRLRSRSGDSDLARLCATLLERDPEELLQREITLQRRRQRRLTAVLIGVTALAVLAVLASVAALLSRRTALEQEREAVAQADATETILLSDRRPDRAIRSALSASSESRSATIRAALMTVINDNAGLTRLLEAAPDGIPPTRLAVNADGSRVLGWRADSWSPGTLMLWDTTTGRLLSSEDVEYLPETRATLLGDSVAAYCSELRAMVVDLGTDPASGREVATGDSCLALPMRDAVALIVEEDSESYATGYLVNDSGDVTRLGELTLGVPHPLSDALLVRDSDYQYSSVRASGTRIELAQLTGLSPQKVLAADQWGRVFASLPGGRWWTGSIVEDDPGVVMAVPAGVPAAVPLRGSSGGAMWVTTDGSVGWSHTRDSIVLKDFAYDPAAAPLMWAASDGGHAAVVYPTGSGWRASVIYISTEPGLEGLTLSGNYSVTAEPDDLAEELRSTGDAIALPTSDTTTLIVSKHGAEELDGVAFIDEASRAGLLYTANGLSYLDLEGWELKTYPLDAEPSLHVAELNSDGSVLAVARPGADVAVYSGDRLHEDSPLVKTLATGEFEPASFGRALITLANGSVLREGSDGTARLYEIPEGSVGHLNAVSPDGAAAVIDVVEPTDSGDTVTRHVLVRAGEDPRPIDDCGEYGDFEFLPGPAARTSIADAQQARLVRHPPNDGPPVYVDCATGVTISDDEATMNDFRVLDYQMDEQRGRLLVRRYGQAQPYELITWNRGEEAPVVTELPVPADGIDPVFDPSTEQAAIWDEEGSSVRLLGLQDGSWRDLSSVATGSETVVWAEPLASESLLITVDSEGMLTLFDSTTGRTVLQEDVDLGEGGGTVFAGRSATTKQGILVTLDWTDDDGSESATTLVIDLDLDAMRGRLCDIALASC